MRDHDAAVSNPDTGFARYAAPRAWLVAAVMLVPTGALAQGGNLPLLLQPGDDVYVTDTSGDESRVRVAAVSPVSLTARNGNQLRVLMSSDIREIKRTRRDPVTNGLAIGIVSGFGSSALYLLAVCREGVDCSSIGTPLIAGATGLGAAIGVTIDALIRKRETIYQNPAAGRRSLSVVPVVTPERKAVVVTLAF